MYSKYWRIALEEALDAASIQTSVEQRKMLLDSIISARDFEFDGTGRQHVPDPSREEIKRLKQESIDIKDEYEARLYRERYTLNEDIHHLQSTIWSLRRELEQNG